jgi:hypothetical protein
LTSRVTAALAMKRTTAQLDDKESLLFAQARKQIHLITL